MDRNRDGGTSLYVCDSPMQIIAAIQMKLTVHRYECADILLTDDVKNSGYIACKIKERALFRQVIHIKGKNFELRKRSTVFKFFFIVKSVLGNRISSEYGKCLEGFRCGWDTIYFFDFTCFLYCLYDNSLKNNICSNFIRFDEGVFCYPMMPVTGKQVFLNETLRKLKGKKSLLERFRQYEVFYPNLLKKYTGKEKRINAIPLFNNNKETLGILNDVFGYDPEKDNIVKQKFIYFPSPYLMDGINVDDLDFLHTIADRVGADNLIVKIHPRDNEQRYVGEGFKVMEKSMVPWEIMQMSNYFKDKILLSLTSTAIIGASAMMDDPIEAYYLFPCLKSKERKYQILCAKAESILQDLHEQGSCLNIKILFDVNEIPL